MASANYLGYLLDKADESVGETAFTTRHGMFRPKRMPEGVGDIVDIPVMKAIGKLARIQANSYLDFLKTMYSPAWKSEEAWKPLIPQAVEVTGLGVGAGWKGGLPKGEVGVGILAGKKAAAIPKGLRTAEKMKAKGAPNRAIWRETQRETGGRTGWIFGPDNQPMFEIDDSLMEVIRQPKVGELADYFDVVKHPELQMQVPQLERNVKVTSLSKDHPAWEGKTTRGFYDREDDIIYLKEGLSEEDLIEVMVHETSHGVDKVMGFPPGGNVWEFMGSSNKHYQKELENVFREYSYPSIHDVPDHKLKELERLAAYRVYKKLAGEYKARDAVFRRPYDKQARQMVPPLTSENLDMEALIVKQPEKAVAR